MWWHDKSTVTPIIKGVSTTDPRNNRPMWILSFWKTTRSLNKEQLSTNGNEEGVGSILDRGSNCIGILGTVWSINTQSFSDSDHQFAISCSVIKYIVSRCQMVTPKGATFSSAGRVAPFSFPFPYTLPLIIKAWIKTKIIHRCAKMQKRTRWCLHAMCSYCIVRSDNRIF